MGFVVLLLFLTLLNPGAVPKTDPAGIYLGLATDPTCPLPALLEESLEDFGRDIGWPEVTGRHVVVGTSQEHWLGSLSLQQREQTLVPDGSSPGEKRSEVLGSLLFLLAQKAGLQEVSRSTFSVF